MYLSHTTGSRAFAVRPAPPAHSTVPVQIEQLLTIYPREIDIVFKKIQEGLHEFNYHYDRYESLNSDEDTDNQREREKLENDLKKEIKRLQKFREQIKIWQLNDVIKTYGLATPQLANKLNENKRWIEDSMEVYKDVERASKLKTFSNQSIMMASLEQMRGGMDHDGDNDSDDEGWNSEEGLVDADDVLENDEDDDELHLAQESIDALAYFRGVLSQLNDQTKKLNSEFEKLSHKKLRKNNLSIIESKKEKISSTKQTHSFHAKKILKLIRLIRSNKGFDVDLIPIIQDDLNNYLEKVGDPDYEVDFSLYDDVFNLAGIRDEKVMSGVSASPTPSPQPAPVTLAKPRTIVLSAPTTGQPQDQDARPATANGPLNGAAPSLGGNSGARSVSPINVSMVSRYASNVEPESPGIVKVLKPASAPTKPLGGLKWLMAAAVGIADSKSPASSRGKSAETADPIPSTPTSSTSDHEEPLTHSAKSGPAASPNSLLPELPIRSKSNGSHQISLLQHLPPAQTMEVFEGESNSKLLDVLKALNVSSTEQNLFSDLNLVRVPPGIQDLVVSCASKRKYNDGSMAFLAALGEEPNPFFTRINKPHLPLFVNRTGLSNQSAKLPVQFFKLQQYWNKIRGSNLFSQFVYEIATNSNQATPETSLAAEELTLVLFFGYYYGLTPMENLIAENCLFQLGWTPYKVKADANLQGNSDRSARLKQIPETEYRHWFKRAKKTQSVPPPGTSQEELGDFQVFDALAWDMFVQYAFKFDPRLSQTGPSAIFC